MKKIVALCKQGRRQGANEQRSDNNSFAPTVRAYTYVLLGFPLAFILTVLQVTDGPVGQVCPLLLLWFICVFAYMERGDKVIERVFSWVCKVTVIGTIVAAITAWLATVSDPSTAEQLWQLTGAEVRTSAFFCIAIIAVGSVVREVRWGAKLFAVVSGLTYVASTAICAASSWSELLLK